MFESKQERKQFLGKLLRKEKTVEEVATSLRCDEDEVYAWLNEEGVDLKGEKKELLTNRPKEELVQEIYTLRSRLSAKDARLVEMTRQAERYKRLYEQTEAYTRRKL